MGWNTKIDREREREEEERKISNGVGVYVYYNVQREHKALIHYHLFKAIHISKCFSFLPAPEQ